MTSIEPPTGSTWPAPPPAPKPPRLGLWARIGLIVGVPMALAIVIGLTNQADSAPVAQSTSAPTTTTPTPRPAYVPPTYRPPVTTAAPAPVVPTGSPRDVTSREWAKIAKSPDQHVGEYLVIYGRVTQFDSATGATTFRADVDGDRHEQWYEYDTNSILDGTSTAGLADVVQDDNFRAEVIVQGSYSYTTTMGGALTVPRLSVVKIEVTGA